MASFQATSQFIVIEPSSGRRIYFSSDFLDESEFISICPNPEKERREDEQRARAKNVKATEFEFLSGNSSNMLPADELFCQGNLIPFCQTHQPKKLNRVALKPKNHADADVGKDGPHGKKQHIIDNEEKNRISWFIDDDPSPRPPKCTVLLKELLRLKKQRSPSSSSSSSALSDDGRKERVNKKSGERKRTGNIRIRPVINVPICSQAKNTALTPISALRKSSRSER
ncbi:hypothetical protein CASFOL_005346 [Castilleja foliolosa]|uniref:Uncharacterized protein n=1 Tax=Castilleja foliolosa TaxID=1961234 RepID=A0ABD3E372_9LAMI